ncbi:hypothetical protein AXF42_Ash017083 [Apostasia shenzhenica]|uniref:SprT-like domain-containing protein n=1 Tax=Apostasia shenzhenica TaxID=1088818 RepID=A0A2H9ZV33_9ASPA|nr:hypothetical protein AXF42_Ash017083 [Apostasia shenzhenica]
MAEPPDIYELFCHYNSLYFDDALGACIVSWTPGMTSTLANCHFAEAGLCEICLSEPLLQSCSSADLKNVLLHAMIHASLLITGSNNHSEHGPDFWAIANLINSNCRDDNKRPSGGYRITAKHLFDEVDLNSGHQWMCVSCGNLIRNGLSREPSPSDCLEKSVHDSDCGNFLCGWHRHKKLCHGKYEKVEYYFGFEDEGKSLDDAEEIDKENPTSLSSSARKARDRLQQGEEIKDKRIIKRPRTVVEFFRSVRGDSTFHGDCSNGKQSTITGVKPSSFSIDPTIPKQPRIPWKKSNLINVEKKCHKREREITLATKIFGVYTDEESGEEDTEPLTNKRSESRKKMRMSKKLEELDG